MRIKFWDGEWIDPEEIPIVVELTEQDKINIANMAEDATLYASFPKDTPVNIQEWLDELKDPTIKIKAI